jgi:hypothetical protein
VYPGDIRDIAFTVSHDGGRTFAPPVRVSEDKWAIDGCPENGPAVAVDGQNRVHVVWPTLVAGSNGGAGSLALFYAMSRDGKQFAPRQSVPTEGTPRHVQIVATREGALTLAWDETAGATSRIVMARATIGASGPVRFQREMVSGSERAVYPVLAATADGVLVAWTSGPADSSVIRLAKR